MEIRFYKCYDKNNKINKTLQNEKIISGSLKNRMSIVNPTIQLKNTIDFNFADYNYCFIVELNRYYFIEDININSNDLFEVELKEDVLMSYRSEINNFNCHIVKYSGVNGTTTKRTKEDYTIRELELNNPFSENGVIIMSALNGR